MADIRTTRDDHTHRDHHDHGDDYAGTLVSATDHPALLSRVSWGAIFAGTVIALAVLIILGMLGTAIGFSAIDPQQGSPFEGVGIGAGIWWIVTSIIALAIGGFVAGRLSGIPDKASSTAHGATVWGLVTLAMLWLAASTAGAVVNTATGAITGAARAAGSVAGTAAQTVAAPGGPEVTTNEIEAQAQQVINSVENQVEQVDQGQLTQQAGETAEGALDAMSSASWYAFFASLLSLAAAVFAAGAGAPRRAFLAASEKLHT